MILPNLLLAILNPPLNGKTETIDLDYDDLGS